MERLGRTEIKYKCCPIEEGEFALSKKMVQKRGGMGKFPVSVK